MDREVNSTLRIDRATHNVRMPQQQQCPLCRNNNEIDGLITTLGSPHPLRRLN